MKANSTGQSRHVLAIGVVAALALTACATVPNLGPRPAAKAAAAYATRRSFAAPAADWPADRWWDAYGDAQLAGLIDEALKRSPDLAQAAGAAAPPPTPRPARRAPPPCRRSASTARSAETEQSHNEGFPPFIQHLLPKGYQDNGRAALDASYDLDLFGRNRAALAAAVSEAAAARADLAQARLTLSTAVAQAYGDLARLEAERDAAAATVTARPRPRRPGRRAPRQWPGHPRRARAGAGRHAGLPGRRRGPRRADPDRPPPHRRPASATGPDRGLDIAMPGRRRGQAVRPAGRPRRRPGRPPPRPRRRPPARAGGSPADRRRPGRLLSQHHPQRLYRPAGAGPRSASPDPARGYRLDRAGGQPADLRRRAAARGLSRGPGRLRRRRRGL